MVYVKYCYILILKLKIKRLIFYLYNFYVKINVEVNLYNFLVSKSMFIVKGILKIVSKINLMNYIEELVFMIS